VKGPFREGRFQNQALLDENALLTAMAYVDLNTVPAGLAETPEPWDSTSIQERLGRVPGSAALEVEPGPEPQANIDVTPRNAEALRPEPELQTVPQVAHIPFNGTARIPRAILYALSDHLELVDWIGRPLPCDKRAHIPARQPKILERIGFDAERSISYAARRLTESGTAAGAPDALASLSAKPPTRYLPVMPATGGRLQSRMLRSQHLDFPNKIAPHCALGQGRAIASV
jgi:hypothetical protein